MSNADGGARKYEGEIGADSSGSSSAKMSNLDVADPSVSKTSSKHLASDFDFGGGGGFFTSEKRL